MNEHGVTRHPFVASTVNELCLSDITDPSDQHWPGEGKLYLCAIEDAFSHRIVDYSIDSRMKSRITVNTLNSAVARR